jgi:hypothetical protein
MGPGGEYPKQIGAKISVKRLRARDSYAAQQSQLRLMPHLWPSGILASRDELETNNGAAMGTGGTYRLFAKLFEIVLFEPHELKAFWAATDLRCHWFPRTLRRTLLETDSEVL